MTRPGYQTARNNQPATFLPGRHYPERRSVYAITPLEHGEISMRLQYHLITLALILSPILATADPVAWQRFAIPETSVAVDIPTTIFTEDAGKPPTGYGRRFLTSDARADFDGPVCAKRRRRLTCCVPCKNEPTSEHRIQEGDAAVLCRLQLSQRENLVQPLQFRSPLHALRID
jgi:hypothetical protein